MKKLREKSKFHKLITLLQADGYELLFTLIMQSDKADIEAKAKSLITPSISRLTQGLPKHELKLIGKEARECEYALMKEIQILEKAAGLPMSSMPQALIDEVEKCNPKWKRQKTEDDSEKKENLPSPSSLIPPAYDSSCTDNPNYLTSVEEILATELTPPDRYFTVSALFGRLRDPLSIPPPPFSSLALQLEAEQQQQWQQQQKSAKKSGSSSTPITPQQKSLDKYAALLELRKNTIYMQDQTKNPSSLLALFKRISNHGSAAVFRRPVNVKEVPGYTDQILFPIDLSLIRKMITSGIIKSFFELHQRIGLICHNCFKFNGRESYYGRKAQEFESYVDDSFLDALQKLTDKAEKEKQANLNKR